jgi:hypothetical protein
MFPVALSLSRFLLCPQSERDYEGYYLAVDVDDMMQVENDYYQSKKRRA